VVPWAQQPAVQPPGQRRPVRLQPPDGGGADPSGPRASPAQAQASPGRDRQLPGPAEYLAAANIPHVIPQARLPTGITAARPSALIPPLARAINPFMIFYEDHEGGDITVYLALPVAERPAEIPVPAQYLDLPEVEVVAAVRSGRAASIFPMVYHDLFQWIGAHGFQAQGPGREIWLNEVDDVAEIEQQVFEVQLPFTRAEPAPA
jgi:hypothetical protein